MLQFTFHSGILPYGTAIIGLSMFVYDGILYFMVLLVRPYSTIKFIVQGIDILYQQYINGLGTISDQRLLILCYRRFNYNFKQFTFNIRNIQKTFYNPITFIFKVISSYTFSIKMYCSKNIHCKNRQRRTNSKDHRTWQRQSQCK